MRLEATSDLWWKNAVVYCVDVEVYADSNGDGVGDFPGLTEHLDYLSGLGVTCLWLLPFYPSPRRDSGYDVADYYGIDPRFGTLGDFVEFVRTATDRGIRVLADLVVNHTSNEHPWFQAARRNRDSPYRGFYVWADEKPPDDTAGIVFPDAETSTWAWDDEAGQYYLHHFYAFQPDLNVNNPQVVAELRKMMGFWLELGVSGFRLDAVPYFLGTDGVADFRLDPHVHLRRMREFVGRRRGDVMLLGEVNVEPKELAPYFGGSDGDELHMLFNFPAMQNAWLALARADASPLVHALRALPPVAQANQYASFLRVHDELTLDRLTLPERDDVFGALAPDPSMQLYGRGIRRRLAPLLGGDRARTELLFSLLFSLPGTPVVFYGDEIGVGDDLGQPGRTAVRVPMQWNGERNAGFSPADPARLVRPLVGDGPFGYQRVNVSEQRHDVDSLLNWVERLIRWRRECPEIGWGGWQVLESNAAAVLLHRCDWQENTLLAAHNFGDREVRVEFTLGLDPDAEIRQELIVGNAAEPLLDVAKPVLTLPAYGYQWLRLRRAPEVPHTVPAEEV